MLNYLLVATGGAIGAVLRFSVSRATSHFGAATPIGTLAVNFTGSYLLALMMFSNEKAGWFGERGRFFLAVGILGAFTTMSTFSLESMELLDDKGWTPFILNVTGTLLLVLLAVVLGKGTSALLLH